MTTPWTTRDIPNLTGKRVIVTGASGGNGWHTALELARAGAEVTIAARDEGKASTSADRIRFVFFVFSLSAKSPPMRSSRPVFRDVQTISRTSYEHISFLT